MLTKKDEKKIKQKEIEFLYVKLETLNQRKIKL